MTTTTTTMSAVSFASSRARARTTTTTTPATPIRARAAVARAGGRARASRRGVEARGANDEEYGSLGQVCTGTSRDEGDRERDRDAIGR